MISVWKHNPVTKPVWQPNHLCARKVFSAGEITPFPGEKAKDLFLREPELFGYGNKHFTT